MVQLTSAQVAMGMALIVLSQAVQAAQITFEDYFMSELSIAPMKIVGYEGVVGSLLMLFVMAPIVRLLPGAPPTVSRAPASASLQETRGARIGVCRGVDVL